MKAALCTKYGPPEVLKIQEVDKPSPEDNEILVKVHASTVSAGAVIIRNGFQTNLNDKMPGVMRFFAKLIFGRKAPKKPILGSEFSGVVEAIGSKVTKFKVGDQVFGSTTGAKAGAYAEYVCVPEEWRAGVIAIKPSNMSFEEAAAVPIGALTANHYLRKKALVKSGQKVLIYGASGSVGTFAVQLAKYLGGEVTGICSTANLELVKSLGADNVIDYTKDNFANSGEKYDFVFDAVGKASKDDCKSVLTPNGTIVSVAKGLARERTPDLLYLKEVIEEGKLKSAIDKIFPFEQIVDAHRHVDSGRKKGNVVIKIAD